MTSILSLKEVLSKEENQMYILNIGILIREAKEEFNLDVEVKQIIHEDSNFDKGKNTMFTRLVYICTLKNTNDYVIQLDPEEHSEYRLISSLDEMFDEKVVPFLMDILSNKNL